MRLDNRGEGGVLSMMALAERGVGRRTMLIFLLGAAGAALFHGDAIITPAITMLSAVEGVATLEWARGVANLEVIIAIAVLAVLFAVQCRIRNKATRFSGPVLLLWFVVLAALGASKLAEQPEILAAFNPMRAAAFLGSHPSTGFLVLGAAFLTVTGAQALHAEMGRFGKKPIIAMWLALVLPALVLNYLGQGATALSVIEAANGARVPNQNWFFLMAPEAARLPLIILAVCAAVVASQSVITSAFQITSQAIQMGLLPRLVVRNTSMEERGRLFMPAVNGLLFVGVVFLVAIFKTSDGLMHAYGLAVAGAMVITTSLAYFVVSGVFKWPVWKTVLVVSPLLFIDLIFLAANGMKLLSGGFVPLLLGGAMFTVMAVWVRGREIIQTKSAKEATPLMEVVGMLDARPPKKVSGVAVFLTADGDGAPMALMHNLKHNRVLHERNIIMIVNTAPEPRVPEEKRLWVEQLSPDFWRVNATWGYMESPDVPRALAACRKLGIKFDIMNTSFFLGRRSVVVSSKSAMPLWQDKLFIALTKNAAETAGFFHLPPGRVVEMGSQVSV